MQTVTIQAKNQPLIDATDIDQQGTEVSLTGSVARGDLEVLRAHIKSIRDSALVNQAHEQLYIDMASQAAESANGSSNLGIKLLKKT